MERDPQDLDTLAHLGQCLLRQKRAAEARRCSEGVVAENPKHDYGYTMMALAETLTARVKTIGAENLAAVTAEHSYARAKVQWPSYTLPKTSRIWRGQNSRNVVSDDIHAPTFQRKRDRVWVQRAKSLMGKLK